MNWKKINCFFWRTIDAISQWFFCWILFSFLICFHKNSHYVCCERKRILAFGVLWHSLLLQSVNRLLFLSSNFWLKYLFPNELKIQKFKSIRLYNITSFDFISFWVKVEYRKRLQTHICVPSVLRRKLAQHIHRWPWLQNTECAYAIRVSVLRWTKQLNSNKIYWNSVVCRKEKWSGQI